MPDGSQTSSTTLAPLSSLGQEDQSLLQSLIVTNLSSSGYDLTPTQKTTYQDPDKAKSIQNQIDGTQAQLDSINADLKANPPAKGAKDPRTTQASKLTSTLYSQKNQLNGLSSTTYTDYSVKKTPDARVTDAITKYGADSPEAKAAQAQITQETVDKATAMAGVESTYLTKLQKYVNGDMSYTPEQAAQVDAYVAPVKDVINKTADDMMKKYGDDDAALKTQLDKVSDAIDKTGFDISSALQAASIQMDKSGKDLNAVLDGVNSSTEAKFKFQYDLTAQQIDKSVDQQAAMLGLPPGSDAANFQKAKLKSDTFTSLQLQLANQVATGKMNVAEQVAAGKQQISFANVNLASTQGAKKEAVAGENLSITANTQQKEESLKSSVGSAMVGLEQTKQNTLANLAYGGIPGQLGAATGAQNTAISQAGATQAQGVAAGAPVTSLLGAQYGLQMAQPTTTQTSSPSFLSSLGSVVGMGAGIAGAALSGGATLAGGAAASAAGAATSAASGGGSSIFNFGNLASNFHT